MAPVTVLDSPQESEMPGCGATLRSRTESRWSDRDYFENPLADRAKEGVMERVDDVHR